MSRIFITGSTEGLGRGAAEALLEEGHEVVLHARSRERAAVVSDLVPRSLGVVVGDLASAAETRSIAEQVNRIGRMDAVIHNAGMYRCRSRDATPEGHARTLAVNTLAPYLLSALVERPARLVYLTSDMHRSGEGSLRDIDWLARRWDETRAYCESKLHVAALASALARLWPVGSPPAMIRRPGSAAGTGTIVSGSPRLRKSPIPNSRIASSPSSPG